MFSFLGDTTRLDATSLDSLNELAVNASGLEIVSWKIFWFKPLELVGFAKKVWGVSSYDEMEIFMRSYAIRTSHLVESSFGEEGMVIRLTSSLGVLD